MSSTSLGQIESGMPTGFWAPLGELPSQKKPTTLSALLGSHLSARLCCVWFFQNYLLGSRSNLSSDTMFIGLSFFFQCLELMALTDLSPWVCYLRLAPSFYAHFFLNLDNGDQVALMETVQSLYVSHRLSSWGHKDPFLSSWGMHWMRFAEGLPGTSSWNERDHPGPYD